MAATNIDLKEMHSVNKKLEELLASENNRIQELQLEVTRIVKAHDDMALELEKRLKTEDVGSQSKLRPRQKSLDSCTSLNFEIEDGLRNLNVIFRVFFLIRHSFGLFYAHHTYDFLLWYFPHFWMKNIFYSRKLFIRTHVSIAKTVFLWPNFPCFFQ